MMQHKGRAMVRTFREFAETHRLFEKKDKALLAVSGGIDSVVMLRLFSEMEIEIEIGVAHCNFKLRGEDSEKDEQFVRELAKESGFEFFSENFDTKKYAAEKKVSIQMAARELRYEWLEKIRRKNNYRCIATAHHKDDNVETVLLNMIKGTGIAGLHGILPKNEKLIRPLLCFTKEEIRELARQENLSFREDRSNAETVYERNKIRLNIIPEFREINPRFIETFSGNIERFSEAEQVYKKGLGHFRKRLLSKRGKEFFLPIELLKILNSKTILFEMLQPFGFNDTQVKAINDTLAGTSPGKQFFSASYRLIKDRRFLIITPRMEEESGYVLVENINKDIKTADFTLHFHLVKNQKDLSKNKDFALLDFSKLEFPLTLRKWKRGDYFYPYGMKKTNADQPGKKKISDFFVDQKLSLLEKERAWVLLSGEKIAWLAGYRIDDRFKVTPATKEVLKIRRS